MIWVINHLLHLGPAEAGKWVHIFKHDYDRWILKLISHILKYYAQYPCPKFVFFERTFCIKHPNFPPKKEVFRFGMFPRNPLLQERDVSPSPRAPPGRGSGSEGWRLCDGHRSGGAAGGHQSRLCHPLPQPRGERCWDTRGAIMITTSARDPKQREG